MSDILIVLNKCDQVIREEFCLFFIHKHFKVSFIEWKMRCNDNEVLMFVDFLGRYALKVFSFFLWTLCHLVICKKMTKETGLAKQKISLYIRHFYCFVRCSVTHTFLLCNRLFLTVKLNLIHMRLKKNKQSKSTVEYLHFRQVQPE